VHPPKSDARNPNLEPRIPNPGILNDSDCSDPWHCQSSLALSAQHAYAPWPDASHGCAPTRRRATLAPAPYTTNQGGTVAKLLPETADPMALCTLSHSLSLHSRRMHREMIYTTAAHGGPNPRPSTPKEGDPAAQLPRAGIARGGGAHGGGSKCGACANSTAGRGRATRCLSSWRRRWTRRASSWRPWASTTPRWSPTPRHDRHPPHLPRIRQ